VAYKDTLAKTAPELIVKPYVFGVTQFLNFQTRFGVFVNENVRRAMHIATDFEAISQAVYEGEAIIHGCFCPGTPQYTPLDELPESTRLLFTYDPVLAKKMLADAGLADGFTVEMGICPSSFVDHLDLGEMIAAQWAEVGVTVELVSREVAAHTALRTSTTWEGTMLGQETILSSELAQMITGHIENFPGWSNTDFDAAIARGSAILDPDERAAVFKDAIVIYVDEACRIQMPCPYPLICWWPWVKNYYGETECGYMELTGALASLWINQDLKAEMGY